MRGKGHNPVGNHATLEDEVALQLLFLPQSLRSKFDL